MKGLHHSSYLGLQFVHVINAMLEVFTIYLCNKQVNIEGYD